MSVVSDDVEPLTFIFEDDGLVPNNPMPFLVYKGAVDVANDHPEKTIEGLFGANGWGEMWRNGVYDYLHYHATVHEVLGVARGHARVRFGGDKGKEFEIAAGDVAILPAGTGHQCLSASPDFCVVGAYPPGPQMHVTRPTPENHAKALKTIPEVKAAEDRSGARSRRAAGEVVEASTSWSESSWSTTVRRVTVHGMTMAMAGPHCPLVLNVPAAGSRRALAATSRVYTSARIAADRRVRFCNAMHATVTAGQRLCAARQRANLKPKPQESSRSSRPQQAQNCTSEEESSDMFRGILKLTLCLCLGAAVAPAALAQGGSANHRAGGARDRGGRLRLLLLPHVDGHVPQAIHQRHDRISKDR